MFPSVVSTSGSATATTVGLILGVGLTVLNVAVLVVLLAYRSRKRRLKQKARDDAATPPKPAKSGESKGATPATLTTVASHFAPHAVQGKKYGKDGHMWFSKVSFTSVQASIDRISHQDLYKCILRITQLSSVENVRVAITLHSDTSVWGSKTSL